MALGPWGSTSKDDLDQGIFFVLMDIWRINIHGPWVGVVQKDPTWTGLPVVMIYGNPSQPSLRLENVFLCSWLTSCEYHHVTIRSSN